MILVLTIPYAIVVTCKISVLEIAPVGFIIIKIRIRLKPANCIKFYGKSKKIEKIQPV